MTEPEQALDGADPRKYMQLAAVLRRRIQEGTLRAGDHAPSISALAVEMGGWARQTVAKAFRVLEADGLLVRVQGLGYYITGPADTEDICAAGRPPVLIVADLLHARRH